MTISQLPSEVEFRHIWAVMVSLWSGLDELGLGLEM